MTKVRELSHQHQNIIKIGVSCNHWYSRPIGSGVLRNSSECDGREAQKHHAAQNTVPQPAWKIVTVSVTAIWV